MQQAQQGAVLGAQRRERGGGRGGRRVGVQGPGGVQHVGDLPGHAAHPDRQADPPDHRHGQPDLLRPGGLAARWRGQIGGRRRNGRQRATGPRPTGRRRTGGRRGTAGRPRRPNRLRPAGRRRTTRGRWIAARRWGPGRRRRPGGGRGTARGRRRTAPRRMAGHRTVGRRAERSSRLMPPRPPAAPSPPPLAVADQTRPAVLRTFQPPPCATHPAHPGPPPQS